MASSTGTAAAATAKDRQGASRCGGSSPPASTRAMSSQSWADGTAKSGPGMVYTLVYRLHAAAVRAVKRLGMGWRVGIDRAGSKEKRDGREGEWRRTHGKHDAGAGAKELRVELRSWRRVQQQTSLKILHHVAGLHGPRLCQPTRDERHQLVAGANDAEA